MASVLEQPDREFPPLERREGAILRLELSGLGPLTEALALRGRAGGEELSQVLSLFLGGMLEGALLPFNGHILRFSGETLTAFFEGEAAASRACRCALQLRAQAATFSTLQTGAGLRSMKVRLGVATGPFSLVYLGAGHDRVACVPGGATVVHAIELAGGCAWGQVAVDDASLQAFPGAHAGAPTRGGRVLESAPSTGSGSPAKTFKWELEQAKPASLERLVPLVPEALALAVDAGDELSSEIKRCSVLLARLPSTDWDSARAPADARALGEVFRNAVLAVRRLGGRVGPVDVASDGHRFLASFHAHASRGDAERAAQCALEFRGLGLAAALDTGSTFHGMVGSSAHKELVITGESVDRAGRYLGLARLGDAIVGPSARAQLWGFGIEALPQGGVGEKGAPSAPGLLLAAREAQALRARPRTSAGALMGGPLGREREFSRIRELGLRARGGRSAMLVIHGERGLGKSALLDAYGAEWNSAGGSAVFVRMTRADSERPWALAGRLMRQLLRLPSDTDPGKAPDTVSRLDRRLSPVAPYAAVLLGAPGQATAEAVHELLRGILAHRAEEAPLLVGVDNAHFADASSAHLWDDLTGDLSGKQLLWLVAHSGNPNVLPSFAALDPERLELGPIDAALSELLMERLEPNLDAAQAAQCIEVAGGNPFLMQSAARYLLLKGSIPKGADLLSAWTSGLDETAQTMAELVSVFGGARASVEVLHEALREFDRRANGRDAVAALEKRNLIERRLGKLRFQSPAVQEAVYGRLPAGRRAALHGSVGRALKLCEPESPAAMFAFHFSRSDSLPEAVRACMRAGEDALRAGAFPEASEFFGSASRAAEASRAPELADTLARQVRAQVRLGRFHEVRALADRAIEVARSKGRSRALAEALTCAAQAAQAQGELERAEACVREATEVVAWAGDAELTTEVYGLAAIVEAAANRSRESARLARQALRSAKRQGTPGMLAAARTALGAAATSGGHLRGAAREHGEAQRLFSIAGEPARALEAAAARAMALVGAGQLDVALSVASEVLSSEDAPTPTRGLARLTRGLALLEQRNAREAEGALNEARREVERQLQGRCDLFELLARALRGTSGAAEGLEALQQGASPALQAYVAFALAWLRVERGEASLDHAPLEKAEGLARSHARELLPTLVRMRRWAANRPVARA